MAAVPDVAARSLPVPVVAVPKTDPFCQMRLIRQIFVLTCFLASCGAVWAAVYARKEGFSESWRNAIEREFESRGYHVDIGKLTLGAFRGLVAEEVRFFQDATREQEIAFIDDVFLDVDLSRILDKQVSINTLDG